MRSVKNTLAATDLSIGLSRELENVLTLSRFAVHNVKGAFDHGGKKNEPSGALIRPMLSAV